MPASTEVFTEENAKRSPVPPVASTKKTYFSETVRFWQWIFAAIVTTVALAYLAFLWGQHSDIAELHSGSERRLAALNAALFAPIDKFGYLPSVTASLPFVLTAFNSQNDRAIIAQTNTALNTLNTTAKSEVIYLLNLQGIVIASSNAQERDSFVGKDYSFRPYFKQAIEHRLGRFYGMGTTSLLPGYYMSSAVMSGDKLVGVAVVKIDMTGFDNGWNLHDQMAVTDGNGIIFLSSIADWKYRPLNALTAKTLTQLRRTRQYDNALKGALDTEVLKDISSSEQLVRISIPENNAQHSAATDYFTKSEKLPDSDWTVHVFIPVDDVDSRARLDAVITLAMLAFVAIVCLYIRQVRANLRDREESRLALLSAHATLEQNHHELKLISERLQITAVTDPLTGAYNRRYFFDATEKLLFSQRSSDSSLSLIMIDIDYFKQINDQHGHPVGDMVLRELTDLARQLLRDGDLFVRFGGEEFMIALPNANAGDAVLIAKRLCEQVRSTRFTPLDADISVTISCGVSAYHRGEPDIDAAIKRADQALYMAKQQGRNRVILGEPCESA